MLVQNIITYNWMMQTFSTSLTLQVRSLYIVKSTVELDTLRPQNSASHVYSLRKRWETYVLTTKRTEKFLLLSGNWTLKLFGTQNCDYDYMKRILTVFVSKEYGLNTPEF